MISLEERAKDERKPYLEQLLQQGARKLLQAAIENEVVGYIQFHKDRRDENGQRLVVRMDICRNGKWSAESLRSKFVSHGSGIATRVDFLVRFCPSICVVDALSSSPLPQSNLDRRF